jgi:hypothetical protein
LNDPRYRLTQSLCYFAQSLQQIGDARSQDYKVWVFPAITAFLLAYLFGVGSRYWRAWWLNNDEERLSKLKDQIIKAYGSGLVTPIEALRYEDYRTKWVANVQKRKIDWKKEFGHG